MVKPGWTSTSGGLGGAQGGADIPPPILTRERFIERYGRFFGSQRMATIQNLGYLLVEAWGEGPYIFDAEGSRYLDLWNVGGVNSLGHRHPAGGAAVEEGS